MRNRTKEIGDEKREFGNSRWERVNGNSRLEARDGKKEMRNMTHGKQETGYREGNRIWGTGNDKKMRNTKRETGVRRRNGKRTGTEDNYFLFKFPTIHIF